MQKAAELVFIPSPGVGHLVSTVEIAKLLVDRDQRLSVTVFIINLPNSDNSKITPTYTRSLDRIKFINLPNQSSESDPKKFLTSLIESQKPHVKEVVSQSMSLPDSPKLAGFVLDMFCISMIDVANDFGVPSYIYFTSGAAFIGLMFHGRFLHDELKKPISDLKGSDTELVVPSLAKPIHVKFLPTQMLSVDWAVSVYEHTRRFKTAKGILVNTFAELESYAVNAAALPETEIPPLYPVGLILNLDGDNYDTSKKAEIMEWLDDQPESSVVFLCFGSMGSFGEDQVKEIACGLEQSGHRFLWSLRYSPPQDKDKDKDKDNVISDEEAISNEGELRVIELGENNCEAELSVNTISDGPKPSTMRLMAWVGKFEVSMLVDSGASHNFIFTNIVKKIGLRGAAIKPFNVNLADGEKLKCKEVVHEVNMNVQGVKIVADLHVLSLVGVDVVLGNAWLKSIGKVVTDFKAMTMKFKLDGRKRTWAALPLKEIKQYEEQVIEKLCK